MWGVGFYYWIMHDCSIGSCIFSTAPVHACISALWKEVNVGLKYFRPSRVGPRKLRSLPQELHFAVASNKDARTIFFDIHSLIASGLGWLVLPLRLYTHTHQHKVNMPRGPLIQGFPLTFHCLVTDATNPVRVSG